MSIADPTAAPLPDPARPPRARVIVVAYQSGDYLQPCLDALAAQTLVAFEAVVADNASTDGSVERLRLPDGRFTVRPMGENLGFAAGNNRAAQDAAAEFLVLLNPDAVAEPTWLEEMIAAADAHPEAASVGATQLRLEDPTHMDGVGDVWHVAGLAWRAGEGWETARAPGDGEIFGPCGAAALYRTADFHAAGGFDERYFCYCEDVDLAFRLRARGRIAWRASRAVVRHAGSGITGRSSDFTLFHGHRNRIWTFFKNTPGAWLWVLLPYHLLFNALYMGLAVRRGFPRPIWRAYRAAWRGLPDILAGRRAAPKGAGMGALFPAMAWTPWSPWLRELRPPAEVSRVRRTAY